MILIVPWHVSFFWTLTCAPARISAAGRGDNDMLVTSLAKNNGTVKIIGLAIANGLVALGGSVMCQQQRFFDLSMGMGTVVICLWPVLSLAPAFLKM